ncbi:MAG: Gfo/Idh/MocA family oxidoreductase [Verrucomicrobia bacterium]|nr:Gfo/Idh/MocA family oxidoreductase [Verrucomicrobiota bacterium]
MKFGIFGGSMIARFHAQAIQAMESSNVEAIYARRQSVAEELASEFGCKAYSDADAFFNESGIEIVTIATPSGAHLEPALQAAAAGKHIICEKPLEISTERVDRMIEATDKAGVTLSGIFNRRFNPAVKAFKAAIEQNRFGNIALAGASIRWYRDPEYYASSNWRGTWRWDGGGALRNQGIHAIDQLLYLAGPVKKVAASTTRSTHKGIEVEDTAVALLEFENGARGIIEGSTACWSESGNPAEIYVNGDQGSVILADGGFRQWEFRESSPEDSHILENLMRNPKTSGMGSNDPKAISAEGHTRNFEDVVSAIQKGKSPSVDGREARKAIELISAIYKSAQSNGQPITL